MMTIRGFFFVCLFFWVSVDVLTNVVMKLIFIFVSLWYRSVEVDKICSESGCL